MEGWPEKFNELVPMFARAGITARQAGLSGKKINSAGCGRSTMEIWRGAASDFPSCRNGSGKGQGTGFVECLDVRDIDYR